MLSLKNHFKVILLSTVLCFASASQAIVPELTSVAVGTLAAFCTYRDAGFNIDWLGTRIARNMMSDLAGICDYIDPKNQVMRAVPFSDFADACLAPGVKLVLYTAIFTVAAGITHIVIKRLIDAAESHE